jgi:hypothetical protein
VILFGAGASFGAGGILPEAPPLGGALFDELVFSYPGSWGQLPGKLSTRFREAGFEAGMQLVFEEYGLAIPRLMRDMAVYFVQFRPNTRSTLYCRLVRGLIEADVLKNVIFGTLNYECVLEYSLLEAGVPIGYFPDSIPRDGVPVWKPHGSCNMFSKSLRAGQSVRYGTGVTWEGGAQAFLDTNRVIEYCLTETGLAPIMSLYMEGKPLAVSPSVVRQIQQALEQDLLNADAVFVVGVRPVLGDKHIWQPLATSDAPVYYVGDQAGFETWRKVHRSERASTHLGDRFGAAFDSILNGVIQYGIG